MLANSISTIGKWQGVEFILRIFYASEHRAFLCLNIRRSPMQRGGLNPNMHVEHQYWQRYGGNRQAAPVGSEAVPHTEQYRGYGTQGTEFDNLSTRDDGLSPQQQYTAY